MGMNSKLRQYKFKCPKCNASRRICGECLEKKVIAQQALEEKSQ